MIKQAGLQNSHGDATTRKGQDARWAEMAMIWALRFWSAQDKDASMARHGGSETMATRPQAHK